MDSSDFITFTIFFFLRSTIKEFVLYHMCYSNVQFFCNLLLSLISLSFGPASYKFSLAEICESYLHFLQFIEKLLDDGAKSPRTIRLAALHLTGLWLLYPKTVKYYIKELKLLALYGSGILFLFFI